MSRRCGLILLIPALLGIGSCNDRVISSAIKLEKKEIDQTSCNAKIYIENGYLSINDKKGKWDLFPINTCILLKELFLDGHSLRVFLYDMPRDKMISIISNCQRNSDLSFLLSNRDLILTILSEDSCSLSVGQKEARAAYKIINKENGPIIIDILPDFSKYTRETLRGLEPSIDVIFLQRDQFGNLNLFCYIYDVRTSVYLNKIEKAKFCLSRIS